MWGVLWLIFWSNSRAFRLVRHSKQKSSMLRLFDSMLGRSNLSYVAVSHVSDQHNIFKSLCHMRCNHQIFWPHRSNQHLISWWCFLWFRAWAPKFLDFQEACKAWRVPHQQFLLSCTPYWVWLMCLYKYYSTFLDPICWCDHASPGSCNIFFSFVCHGHANRSRIFR